MINKLQIDQVPETKSERMELVLNKMIESLPMTARILVTNSLTSFLQSSEESAEKVLHILKELQDFIGEGVIPHDETRAENITE